MTRQRMFFIVSALTVLAGIAAIWSFLSPIFDPNKPNELDPFQLMYGTGALLVGWGLFRRNEFALDLSFWLWFLALIGLALRTAFLFTEISDFTVSRNRFGVLLLIALLVVHLFTVIFLSQKETKRLFTPASAKKLEGNS